MGFGSKTYLLVLKSTSENYISKQNKSGSISKLHFQEIPVRLLLGVADTSTFKILMENSRIW